MHLRLLATIFFVHSAIAINSFYGIAVSGFTAQGNYRNEFEWDYIIGTAKKNGYRRIRIYGNDEDNTFDRVTVAAKKHGVSVLFGIWVEGKISDSAAKIDKDVHAFANIIKKHGADHIDGLIVGDDVSDSPKNIADKVNEVRNHLKNTVGYTGPISTASGWEKVVADPILCGVDRITVNALPFYDKTVHAANAGNFINEIVVPKVLSACKKSPAKRIVVTESGWPSRGGKNGEAVPSIENEQAALKSLNCAAKKYDIIAFEAEDSLWKKGGENEKSFGILGKPGIDSGASACLASTDDAPDFVVQDA